MLGIAQTGSGKTAAFGLPILAGLLTLTGRPRPMTTRALILAPTRELAVQIDEAMRKFAGSKMQLETVLRARRRVALPSGQAHRNAASISSSPRPAASRI